MQPQPSVHAERVGANFSVDGMLHVRNLARGTLAKIAGRIQPGMVEEDAVEMAKEMLVEAGLTLSWHPTRVRFGRNTTKPMRVASDPGVVLQDNDIFFLDMAPRFDAWEGDIGASFTVGDAPDYARCARDAQTLFHETRRLWLEQRVSGAELYRFATARAQEMGWILNPALPGHRLSDFPHAALHTGALAEFDSTPAPLRWVLEIHLVDPAGRFGAFYEDLLLEDADYE